MLYFAIINIFQPTLSTDMPCQPAGSQHKCHMKRGLEFKKNAIGHMTFAW